jgi:glucose/arabinose dehydrogenase
MREGWLPWLSAVMLAAAGCGDDAAGSDGGRRDAQAAESGMPDGGDDGGADDAGAACAAPDLPALTVESIAGGTFDSPVYVTQAPEDDESLYVVEQPGRIKIVRGGSILSPPFLDISSRVDFGGERGLLGLAFHPDYAQNGRFFIYYTPAGEMRNVVAEYARDPDDPDQADPEEVRRLIEPQDPDPNHDGGMLTFGPDGYLYAGMGDGGGACDRHGENGNAQDLSSPFGKIHRFDVDAADQGFAAEGNPFLGQEGLDTIWAYGLRNPWRFSFDRATGDLYIGDVGQNAFEEINFESASSDGGENYGWRDFEGTEPSTASGCSPTGLVEDHHGPILTYPHPPGEGRSVNGGYVYRGQAIPELRGVYFYGDFVSNEVRAFRYCNGQVVGDQGVEGLSGGAPDVGRGLASFGQDNAGELYVVRLVSGTVKRIVEP